MEAYKSPLKQSEALQKTKPFGTTPEQMESIRKSAIDEFGTTNRYKEAFYMYPNGQMLSGMGGQRYGRVVDHREINSPYFNNNIELDDNDSGNSTNMLDFMRGGNIRMIPETKAIDLMVKPSDEQMRHILNMYRQGALDNIQVSNAKDKYGQQLGYLEEIKNEAQITNFLRKYFG